MPMLQTLFEKAFKEYLLVFVQFSFSPEAVMLPLANVFINFIEPISSSPTSFSSHKLSVINIPIIINCLALSMRLGGKPSSVILLDVIVLYWFILIDSFSLGLSLMELSFIDRTICESEDSIALLLIIFPLSFIYISIGKSINSISVLKFA